MNQSLEMLYQLDQIIKNLDLPTEQVFETVKKIVNEAYVIAGQPYGPNSSGRWIWEKVQTGDYPAVGKVIGETVQDILTFK